MRRIEPAATPDDDVVRRAQAREPDAFEALYRAHVGHVYAVCLRFAGERQRAEQLTQDVFVRVWEKLPTFRGDSRFSTWLHRLAVNVALSRGRSETRWAETFERMTEAHAEPAVHTHDGERLDLERAIASLPAGARQALVLHDIHGYRYDEIATEMGVAIGTVKAQIHRARRLLRERLDA